MGVVHWTKDTTGIRFFAECFFFGHSAKKAFAECLIKTLGKASALDKEGFAECQIKNTRQRSFFAECCWDHVLCEEAWARAWLTDRGATSSEPA
jgi:hypothetical protein